MLLRPPYRLIAVVVGMVALALIVVGWTFLRTDAEDAPAEPPQEWEYVTAPDVMPPVIDVSRYDVPGAQPETDDEGLIFLGPKDGDSMTGPLIVNADGAPVWIGPEERAYDVRVQHYQGEPVLTYWRGETVLPYYGVGEFVLLNQHYEEVATVSTHGLPQRADYHEMTLTDDGTALMIGHRLVRRDLSAKGGARRGWVADGIVQEVDVATGKVLFEWHTLGHIPINQSMTGLRAYGSGTRGDPYDYAHVNSVTEDGDDAFLISARNTSAVYRVDRKTGDIDWTLGGKASDFAMAPEVRFYWQHDAQRQDDGTITLFDNEGAPPKAKRSRGLRLALDLKTHTARVVTEYLPPDDRLAGSQGNLQVMPNGHVFVGWGSQHYYSEYTADGDLLLDADFGTGESYRSYRFPWVGRPSDPPVLTVADGTAYVSWNGATEVTSWRFLAGDDAHSARNVGTVRREGFETSAEIPNAPYVAVQALDADGKVLATVER
ncbi:MAG TPA: arylsulfotransferase family protein [Nocardioidaceae bacterium]|nr:arylsulfotransferase family protein [Nocardioidaceae bacterium]